MRFLDIGQQLFHAVKQLGVYRAITLIAFQKLLAQFFEARCLWVHAEGRGDHCACTAGNFVADQFIGDRWQATIGAHGLADGDKVRRGVEQGAVHVKKNCS